MNISAASDSLKLTREVRLAIPSTNAGIGQPVLNSWGGWPPEAGLAPQIALQVTLAGQLDPDSGYLCNIRTIDERVRELLCNAIRSGNGSTESVAALLPFFWNGLQSLNTGTVFLESLACNQAPWLRWFTTAKDFPMILLTRQYEFAASHRLHNPDLTDDRNRELFGKCNNPRGHGHNYVVEVSVAIPGEGAGTEYAVPDLDAAVRTSVIDRLDHRHLNEEVEEFRTTNPTVENIAATIWNWLSSARLPAPLRHVRVYETPKTWADYSPVGTPLP